MNFEDRFSKQDGRDPYWHVKIGHGDLEEISRDQEQKLVEKTFEFVRDKDIKELEEIMRDEYKDRYTDAQIQKHAWVVEDEAAAIGPWRQRKWEEILSKTLWRIEHSDMDPKQPTRLDEEVKILNDIENGRPVVIQGVFGMGKSQAIRSLMKQVYGPRHSLFLETWTMSNDAITPEKFLRNSVFDVASLLQKRAKIPHDRLDETESQIRESGNNPFAYLEEQLAKENDSILLVVDELTDATRELYDFIAQLSHYPHIKIVCIVHPFNREGRGDVMRDSFKDFSWHFLRPLTIEETGAMIRRYLSETPIIVSDRAIEEVWRFSGGFPRVINEVVKKIITTQETPKLILRSNDIKDVFPQLIKDVRSFVDDFTQNIWGDMERTFRGLSESEQEIIKKIVQHGAFMARDATENEQQSIVSLVQLGIIKKDRKGYIINGEFLERILSEIVEEGEMS